MNPPPPPPPHGSNNGARGGLPEGNYDIFIIPPHSAGGGFLYLPSLQPHRNSFLAGVACTVVAGAIWSICFPVLREWLATIMQSGGMGVIVLMMITAIGAWAWGKTQAESGGTPEGGTGGAPNMNGHSNPAGNPPPNANPHPQPPPPPHPPPPQSGPEPRAPPKPTWQRANTGPANATGSANTGTAKGSWEKAREETRKKEEERKKAEDLRKKREDDERERVRQRERDARERELREARERREKEAQERARAPPPPPPPPNPRKPESSRPASPTKRHQQPTAKTATDDDTYSYRPYDEPKRSKPKTATASSIYSESSYAPSQSTSRTTPPPSHRGPYRSKDPDKILLKAVYSFNNTFTKLPIAQLVSGVGSVTDGLILRITTEGLFIDDDVRSVPQREWDVKAWTLKLVESGQSKDLHVLRANIRDQEGKRYVFILPEEEGWKVAVGLQRLRRGTQVRALGVSGMPLNETKAILEGMGWT